MKTLLLIFSWSVLYIISLKLPGGQFAIISTPGMQRIYERKSCSFQWNVTIPLTNYTVYNFTKGRLSPLREKASYTADEQNGLVNFTILDVRLWDAGNYSLTVTTGNDTEIDTGALLFVYGYVEGRVIPISNPTPATEGQRVEFNCSITESSLPVVHRMEIKYIWRFNKFGRLEYITNGPAITENGDVLNGYSMKNDGRTLVIDQLQCPDVRDMGCGGCEENTYCGFTYFALNPSNNFYCRPYTISRFPENESIAVLHTAVYFNFSGETNPKLTSNSSWSFINAAGRAQNLPPSAFPSNKSDSNSFSFSLTFDLSSKDFYGNYSITLTNSIGSTTEVFQVLPPDVDEGDSGLSGVSVFAVITGSLIVIIIILGVVIVARKRSHPVQHQEESTAVNKIEDNSEDIQLEETYEELDDCGYEGFVNSPANGSEIEKGYESLRQADDIADRSVYIHTF